MSGGGRRYLYLRLDGPLQSWGGVALDPVRPTRRYPSLSALAGLVASALGWTYRDADRTTALQDAMDYAVQEVRRAEMLLDFQTADLDGIGASGWTRWGIEKRAGSAASGTQILWKHYLADGEYVVALGLEAGSPVSISDVKTALAKPARPLFLGRKSCLPASPILAGEAIAESAYDALLKLSNGEPNTSHKGLVDPTPNAVAPSGAIWYADGRGPDEGEPERVWDRRDFLSDRFGGERVVRQIRPTIHGDKELES